MIGRLCGTVAQKQAPEVLLDVQGVGYEVQVPMTTFYCLPESEAPVTLYTHFAVTETSQQLFGFISERDRQLFRLLIKVSGVGPKMAVGILSMESDDFVRCVRDTNINALVKVPGVGKKTAERLMIEMRDKLTHWSLASSGTVAAQSTETRMHNDAQLPAVGQQQMIADAEAALIALGYKPALATKAVSRALSDDVQRSEDLIRAALRSMLPA